MPVPTPEPGLVISFSYLWRHEHETGREEGRKDRPCVIVLAVAVRENVTEVTIAPVTHTPPADPETALELPPRVKRNLGLDDARSWVVISEVNQFAWPGFDIRPVPGSGTRYDYGFVPPRFLERIKAKILDRFMNKRAAITRRD